MNKEPVLKFDVCTYSEQNLLEDIFADYSNNEQLFIVNINPEIIMSNYKNLEIIQKFNKQKYQIPDGNGIVWASKKNKGLIRERITGIDFMQKICQKSQDYYSKIFLYGSKPGIAQEAKSELESLYKDINIVGICDGYCDEAEAIQKIDESKADILFVGLGSPKQEKFILDNMSKLKSVCIFMPVGGSFDVISKYKKRAPNWMLKCNLEWLYRLIKEPKRFFRQIRILKFIYLIKRGNKSGKN